MTISARRCVLAAFVALALAGCASPVPPPEEPSMDHTEARAELDALLQAAQDVLPGEWDVSDSGARTCTLPSGERGVDYALTRFYGRGVPV